MAQFVVYKHVWIKKFKLFPIKQIRVSQNVNVHTQLRYIHIRHFLTIRPLVVKIFGDILKKKIKKKIFER